MSRAKLRIAALALLLAGSAASAQTVAPAPQPGPEAVPPLPPGRSVWVNQDGSVLVLAVEATGAVGGTFTPGFACGGAADGTPAAAAAWPVVGAASANALVWTVTLVDCGSVGTWIGHYEAVGAREQLRMLWILALAAAPPGVGATLTGSDVFVRQPG